jgi:multiple sugar transport system substrate-binding protein
MSPRKISRRHFLRSSVVASASLLVAACAPAALSPTAQPKATETPNNAPSPTGTANSAVSPTGTANSASPSKLRLITWETGSGLDVFKKAVADFQSTNPNIQIEVTTPAGDYYTVLQTQVAGGDPPDLIQIGEAYLPPWAEKGALLPLDSYISSDPDSKLEDFYSSILKVFQYKGKTYVLPKDWVSWALFYNKTLFDKAKLAYPDENWTEDQYRQAAQALTVKDSSGNYTQYGNLVDTGWGNYFPMVWQHGGQYLNDTHAKCLLDSPEVVEGWQFWSDIFNKDKSAPTPGVASQAGLGFETGKIGMAISGSYQVPGYQKITAFQWDIAPKPKGPKGRASILYGSGWGISSKSKSPDQAWQFTKYMTYKGAELLASQGFSIPSRQSVASKPGVYVGAELTKGKNVDVFVKASEYSHLHEVTGTWNQQDQAIKADLDLVWLGQKSVADAVKSIVPQIDALLTSQ